VKSFKKSKNKKILDVVANSYYTLDKPERNS
jgi:hypothetical protein